MLPPMKLIPAFRISCLIALMASTAAADTPMPIALTTIADVAVRNGEHADRPEADAVALQLKKSAQENDGYSRIMFFKFDLSSAPSVARAVLRVYGGIHNVDNLPAAAYAVKDSSWTEAAITWNNQPPADPAPLSTTILTKT